MKDSLRAKLDELIERHEDLAYSMSDPEVINDQDKFRRMSQEYAQLESLAQDYRAWRDLTGEVEGLEDMENGDDAELAEMAEAELADARPKADQTEAKSSRSFREVPTEFQN